MNLSVKADDSYGNKDCKIACDYEILRKSPIFAGADSEVVKLFAYLSQRKSYKPGELIITLDKDADFAFSLISGSAEITTVRNNQEVVLQNLEQNTLCGELALLANFKWFFNVRAIENCEAIITTRESFQKVLERFPDKREKIIEKIVQLRVDRLVEQTNFMLDALPESLLSRPEWTPAKITI